MQYMANVNRIINYIIIPILLGSYTIYLYIDHNSYQDNGRYETVNTHLTQIRETKHIDSYIFGGSNSYYSLSANILSTKTNQRWYNASLLHEGFSIKNYQNFLLEISTIVDKKSIKNIVYSSITPYREGRYDKIVTLDNIAINGQRDIGLKPQQYAFDYLTKNKNKNNNEFKKEPTKYGDIDFNKLTCNLKSRNLNIEREKIKTTIIFLINQTLFLAKTFPNASLFIVLPSEFYETDTPNNDYNNLVKNSFTEEWNSIQEFKNRRVKLIIQPPFSNIDMICDGKHHANKKGRIWRTQHLLTMMK